MHSNLTSLLRRAGALACSAIVGALTLGATLSVDAAPQVTLRVYSSLPADENSSHYVWFKRFQANLDNTAKGQIKLNYFPNSMLGKEADAVQQMRVGAINMMISGTSIWATLVPEIGVLDLGYLFKDWDQVGATLDGPAGATLAGLMLKKSHVKVLGYGYSMGARNIYSRTPVNQPADLRNMKVRVLPVPNFINTLNAMGVAAIPMPLGEVYSGLQTGVIDGVEQDAPTVFVSKYYEIAKYCTLTQHIYNPIVATINQGAFERIPANMQADVLAAATEATIYERQQATLMEQQAISELKKKGVVFNTTDREHFRELVQPVWQGFANQYPEAKTIIAGINGKSE